jgi:hypothetical protein
MKPQTQELLKKLTTPEVKAATLSINVKRFFTDVDGVVIDKAAAPAALQVSYPVYMLGNFDFAGGFKQANNLVPPINGAFYVGTFIMGSGIPFHSFNVVNTINSRLLLGDIVHIFTDNVLAPNYFVYIVQSANTVSLAAVISNTESARTKIEVSSFNYFTDNLDQWNEAVTFITFDVLGQYTVDSIQPLQYRNPYTPANQGNFIEVLIGFPMTQFLCMAFYFAYETDVLKINFKITK